MEEDCNKMSEIARVGKSCNGGKGMRRLERG